MMNHHEDRKKEFSVVSVLELSKGEVELLLLYEVRVVWFIYSF